LPWVHCHFNWLPCHEFIAFSIGFIATGSLPFPLASLPQIHCHFNWLHCPHGITLIWLASLPVLGYIAFPIVIQLQISGYHAITFDQISLVIKPHLPFGAPFAFWHPIYLLAPQLPLGDPIPSDVQFQYLWQKVTWVNVPPSHPIFF
jgi:hypothetical protein